jgi:hypothetical protein
MRRTLLHIYSTAHLPEGEREAIDRLIVEAPCNAGGRLVVEHLDLLIEPYQFGFFVHTGACDGETERPDSVSPEFWGSCAQLLWLERRGYCSIGMSRLRKACRCFEHIDFPAPIRSWRFGRLWYEAV